MQARVLRIGQLSGDTQAGIWNETEAIPLMIRSALATGTLPALDEQPSWLPVDVCARAIAELSLAPQPAITNTAGAAADANDGEEMVYHVLNPRTFSFRFALLPTLESLAESGRYPKFDIVSPQVWLEKLAASEQDPAKNPSIKLLDFWKGKYGTASETEAKNDDDEGAAGLTFETEKTVEDCAVLGQVGDPVSEGLIGKYVDAWMGKWRTSSGSP